MSPAPPDESDHPPGPAPGAEPARPLGLGPAPAHTGGERTRPAQPPIDPRPYRIMIGALAVVLLVAFSVYRLSSHTPGTIGVPAGIRLRWFAAPLAGSSLVGDANVDPPCTSGRHDPRALNVCLDAARGPLVLGFFVTGSASCIRAVDALQALAVRFHATPVQFAAVAVRTGPSAAAEVLRSHHWTIPVAYDRDGAVGALYGVAVCPLVELARRGGIVASRLIGDRWANAEALAARVDRLLAG